MASAWSSLGRGPGGRRSGVPAWALSDSDSDSDNTEESTPAAKPIFAKAAAWRTPLAPPNQMTAQPVLPTQVAAPDQRTAAEANKALTGHRGDSRTRSTPVDEPRGTALDRRPVFSTPDYHAEHGRPQASLSRRRTVADGGDSSDEEARTRWAALANRTSLDKPRRSSERGASPNLQEGGQASGPGTRSRGAQPPLGAATRGSGPEVSQAGVARRPQRPSGGEVRFDGVGAERSGVERGGTAGHQLLEAWSTFHERKSRPRSPPKQEPGDRTAGRSPSAAGRSPSRAASPIKVGALPLSDALHVQSIQALGRKKVLMATLLR